MIAVIVLVALYRLVISVFTTLLPGADPLDYKVFQAIFGGILTLLIGMLALARKFMILDLDDVTVELLLGLAAATLALALSYWLIREREDRQQRDAGLVGTGH